VSAEESHTVLQVAKRCIPRPLRAALRYYRFRLAALVQSLQERGKAFADEGIALPPPLLRYRVHGDFEGQSFVSRGRRCVDDLKDALKSMGKDFDSFGAVLDFGCGCGRTLRHLSNLPESSRLYGTDIDRQAIKWCRSNIPFGRFTLNQMTPPLPFADGTFDLIYGISVFTHLDQNYQFAWLKELKRVAQSGGILLLTVHGTVAQDVAAREGNLSLTELAALRETGFLYKSGETGKFKLDGLPDFYQAAFHTKLYVNEFWARFFTIRKYFEAGLNGHQDLVLLSND
jgi:SAM-dependent methyltransferase